MTAGPSMAEHEAKQPLPKGPGVFVIPRWMLFAAGALIPSMVPFVMWAAWIVLSYQVDKEYVSHKELSSIISCVERQADEMNRALSQAVQQTIEFIKNHERERTRLTIAYPEKIPRILAKFEMKQLAIDTNVLTIILNALKAEQRMMNQLRSMQDKREEMDLRHCVTSETMKS